MNCKHARNLLLRSARPDEPAADVRTHLTVCAACREWQQRLLVIERNVPKVPVPPSRTKVDFVKRITTLDIHKERARQAVPARRPSLFHRRPLILSVSLGLAAAVALVAVGLVFMQGKPQEAVKGPLLERLLQRDLQLVSADTPRQRVETLAALANELYGETPALAKEGTAEDLKELALMFGQVVDQGIVKHAARLPAVERKSVLEPIAQQLERAQKNAEQLANRVPRESADALRKMADTARKASQALRDNYAGQRSSPGATAAVREVSAVRGEDES